jgi:hypothetical protein
VTIDSKEKPERKKQKLKFGKKYVKWQVCFIEEHTAQIVLIGTL